LGTGTKPPQEKIRSLGQVKVISLLSEKIRSLGQVKEGHFTFVTSNQCCGSESERTRNFLMDPNPKKNSDPTMRGDGKNVSIPVY
jgi:hypothetical protein